MANLRSDEITKIRGEETFRPENHKKWLGHLWKQLKSPQVWGITVATVLAISSASLFTQYQVEKRFNVGEIYVTEKLIAEINFRATVGSEYLDTLEQLNKSGKASVSDLDTYKLMQHVTTQMVHTSRDKSSTNRYVYASMYLLLAQLENSKHDSDIQIIIANTIASTLELDITYNDIRNSKPNITVDEFIMKAKTQLKNLAKVTGYSYLTITQTISIRNRLS